MQEVRHMVLGEAESEFKRLDSLFCLHKGEQSISARDEKRYILVIRKIISLGGNLYSCYHNKTIKDYIRDLDLTLPKDVKI